MKNVFTASSVILAINTANAQTKIGLKLSSSINSPRISYTDGSYVIDKRTNAFNPLVVLFADMALAKNHYFSTGMGYISKRINLATDGFDTNLSSQKHYNIQYVQIPATLKLFTDEVALDKKLYFQFGPLFDIAVHHKENNPGLQIIKKFRPIDISLLFAAGMQIQLAPQTAVQIGVSYTRGLINVARKTAMENGNLIIKNDLYGIDLAVRF